MAALLQGGGSLFLSFSSPRSFSRLVGPSGGAALKRLFNREASSPSCGLSGMRAAAAAEGAASASCNMSQKTTPGTSSHALSLCVCVCLHQPVFCVLYLSALTQLCVGVQCKLHAGEPVLVLRYVCIAMHLCVLEITCMPVINDSLAGNVSHTHTYARSVCLSVFALESGDV